MTPSERSAFEDRLRSLALRPVSGALHKHLSARLEGVPGRRRAAASLVVATAAVLGAAAVTIGLSAGRHGTATRPAADNRDPVAPAGCGCRVRFLRHDPARPSDRPTDSGPLDLEARTALRS